MKKILYTGLLLLSVSLGAENIPVPPQAPASVPGQGGGGGDGFGTPASPIDMYVYALMIAAMLFIVYYARRTSTIKTD